MNRAPYTLLLLCVACATTPEADTIAEHRVEAAKHREKAEEETAKYDPAVVRGPMRTPFAEPDGAWVPYNPTEQHLAEADAELREAARHARAADALAAFEAAACKGIPAAERASCPLLASQVKQVQPTVAGLRLALRDPKQDEAVNGLLNCHLAYAVANGFEQPSCPLFVEGMTIRVAAPGVLELTAPRADAVQKLHQQAKRIFTREAPAPLSKR